MRRALPLLLLLAACMASTAEVPDTSIVSLRFSDPAFDGTVVEVGDALGVVGTDATLEVAPALRGDRFPVRFRRGEVVEEQELLLAPDFDTFGIDAARAVTVSITLWLVRRPDGSCELRFTNLLLVDAADPARSYDVFATYEEAERGLCGAFASEP